jgi:regulatory protein
MEITGYSKQVHNDDRFNIEVDGKYAFSLSTNGLLDSGIYVGKKITQEEIDEIVLKDNKEVAFNRVLNILSKSMKTQKEVETKLRAKKDSRGRDRKVIFNETEIAYAIEKAKKYGYLNDEYYVKCFIEERAIPNRWGKQKVVSVLYQKGIDKELIDESIEKYFSLDIQEDSAYKIALKKYNSLDKKKYDLRTCKQKIYAFLMGKGFSYDIIKEVVNKIIEEDDDDYCE